jgi:hypothetical protein
MGIRKGGREAKVKQKYYCINSRRWCWHENSHVRPIYCIWLYYRWTTERVRWKTLEFSRKINSTIQGPLYNFVLYCAAGHCPTKGVFIVTSQHRSVPVSPRQVRIELYVTPITYRKRNSRACMYEKLAISKNWPAVSQPILLDMAYSWMDRRT